MDTASPQAMSEVRSAPSSPTPSSPDAEDIRVIRHYQQGESPKSESDAAFARLYDRHAAVVLALCRQHAGGDTDADDALQETFVRAYRMLDRLELNTADSTFTVRPWLYAVARNVCSEMRRSAHRRTAHENTARQLAMFSLDSTSSNHTTTSSTPLGAMTSPSDSAGRTEELRRLSGALDQLSDSERLAIHLYYLDVDPVAAATNALGVSRSGYYKLLSTARTRLAAIMNAHKEATP